MIASLVVVFDVRLVAALLVCCALEAGTFILVEPAAL